MSIGELIKAKRLEKKMSIRELGNLLNMSTSNICRYEKGYIKDIRIETVKKLCEIFDLKINDFIDTSETIKGFNVVKTIGSASNEDVLDTKHKKKLVSCENCRHCMTVTFTKGISNIEHWCRNINIPLTEPSNTVCDNYQTIKTDNRNNAFNFRIATKEL